VALSKQERHTQETQIFALRTETGLGVFRNYLWDATTELNRKWPGMVGEELFRAQGEQRLLNRLITLLDDGPRIKSDGGA
jgi:hypothetical protein